MARITVEDCLKRIPNTYELVVLATRRARQIYRGDSSQIKTKNKIIVTSLREIAAGRVTMTYGSDENPAAEIPN
jgi:DNA-directed RNA polymerase subunit omega